MKCPNCGQWNRNTLPRCIACGAELPADSAPLSWKEKLPEKTNKYISVDDDGQVDVTEDSRDSLATEMSELKTRKQQGTEQQRQLRREGALHGRAPSAMTIRTNDSVDAFWHTLNDNPAETVTPHKEMRQQVVRSASNPSFNRVRIVSDTPNAPENATAAQPIGRTTGGAWDGGRAFDPLAQEQAFYDAYQPSVPLQLPRRLPSPHRGQRHLMRILLILLAASMLAIGGYFGITLYQRYNTQQALLNKPSVTASILDDLAAHTILIPGEDGQQIYIQELHTSYMVTGGFATIEVADHIFYDDLVNFKGESIEVTLTPFVKTSGGQQKPLQQVSYDVSIPESPIMLLAPDSTRIEVSTAMYSMNFRVRPGSQVLINGQDVSDAVNADTGDLVYNATVQPIGDNTFVITVRSQYCRESTMQVVLYRAKQEIPLDLNPHTYSTTNENAVKVTATTLAGATVEVLSPHTDLDITQVDSIGEFTFYAVFDHIGNNTISISASYPGKKTSVVDYNMYYVPPPNVYTPKAWPLDSAGYAELLANITYRAEHSQIYLVEGTVLRTVSTKPQMVVINTSADGQSQPVLVENSSKTVWEEGQYYRIYADAYATYESMPWLVARYTYPGKK